MSARETIYFLAGNRTLRQAKLRHKIHRGREQVESFWALLHNLPVKCSVLNHARTRENKELASACHRALLPSLPVFP